MPKKILSSALAFILAFAVTAHAKVSDANIGGHVIDAETGEHMPYYLVKVLGTKLATLTDASGHYIFRDLTPGEYTLEASFTGYKTKSVKVSVKSGQSVEANFDVEPDAFMLDQVVVTSSKSEIKRRESPSSPARFSTASAHARLPTASTSSLASASRTIARTAVSPRCASTASTATTRRYS